MELTKKEALLGGRPVWLWHAPSPRALLVQPVGRHERQEIEAEAGLLAETANVPFVLAAFAVERWADELSPWPLPQTAGADGTGGRAAGMLAFVADSLLPALARCYGPLPVALGGYSLAALFALWAARIRSLFAAVAAASPSLWVDEWPAFAATHPMQAPFVYLSLGRREELARHTAWASVGNRVRAEAQALQARPAPARCVLEWNEGGHFSHPERRMARAFSWVLAQLDDAQKGATKTKRRRNEN